MKKYLKKALNILMRPEMMILPGQLAFFLVLSIFPLLTLIGYIGSNISIFAESFISIIKTAVPVGVVDIILPFLTESHITGNVAFFMIIGFYLVSNATNSLIIASNELYHIPHSPFLQRRIKAFFMITILMLLFMFDVLVLGYGNTIALYIVNLPIFENINTQLYTIFVLFKWPVAFIFIFWLVKLLYALAPDDSIPSKYMNKGAMFTTLGWILATAIYSFYISNFANYQMFYGGIAAIIVVMIWIYFISYIFVLGIAINATEYEDEMNKTTKIE